MIRRASAALAALVIVMAGAERARATFGDPVPGLTATQAAHFADAVSAFRHVETAATGLGPVFNGVACTSCHNRPRVGGGSDIFVTRFGRMSGQGFDPLTQLGGSGLQFRGIGIVGSCDYAGERVPAEATIVAARRSTPLFGFGFVNAVPDSRLQAIAANQQATMPATAGRVNMVLDVPTGQMRVGRFGWKAQVATLYHFSGEAFVNEMGITNHLFPTETCPQGDCASLVCDPVSDPEDDSTNVELVRDFMVMLQAPPTRRLSPRALRGEGLFMGLGCANCHVPSLQTGPHPIAALDSTTFHPYSDFLLHDMGALGDGIGQGQATGQEMRTAPLWGLRRQRRLFLHDGRARSFEGAILAHDGQARASRDAFALLSRKEQRAIVAFLRSI